MLHGRRDNPLVACNPQNTRGLDLGRALFLACKAREHNAKSTRLRTRHHFPLAAGGKAAAVALAWGLPQPTWNVSFNDCCLQVRKYIIKIKGKLRLGQVHTDDLHQLIVYQHF